MAKKMTKTFNIGDYIVYDRPNNYWDEGNVIDTGDGSYVTIESINGNKRTFFQSTDFKYLFVA